MTPPGEPLARRIARLGSSGHVKRMSGDSVDTSGETPADLDGTLADDAWLTMLAGNARSSADDVPARVLGAWRRDVDAEPFGAPLDADTAMAAVRSGRRSRFWRRLVATVQRVR